MANFNPYNYNEEITNYLFNDMTEPERTAFEKRLLTDSELAEEVEQQKTILRDISARLIYKQAMEDPYSDEFTAAYAFYVNLKGESQKTTEERRMAFDKINTSSGNILSYDVTGTLPEM